MPAWFWLNIPPGAAFISAVAGVPFWMVLRWPDEGPGPDTPPGVVERVPAQQPEPLGQHEAQRV